MSVSELMAEYRSAAANITRAEKTVEELRHSAGEAIAALVKGTGKTKFKLDGKIVRARKHKAGYYYFVPQTDVGAFEL